MSEYRRNYLDPQSVPDPTHSPDGATLRAGHDGGEGQALGPHPHQDHVISAGLSSVKMGVTQEPAFSRKRKLLDHEKRVTFTTDYAENGSPTKEVSQ